MQTLDRQNGTAPPWISGIASQAQHDKVLRTFRCLVADLCQQHNGGHPGGPMSMAAIGVALYRYVMVYSPRNPRFFPRDRLVLSNGHVCLWQYIFMHLTGYSGMTMDQLKPYRSADPNSLCPASTQIQQDGIEASTGALGQGVAQAVGLAAAAKHLGAKYNRPGFLILDNMTWCTVGDACLQEGVALEAIQLAGHWRLDNLAIVYDNNQITCSGSVDVTCSEDINAKMAACGWNVIDVYDGSSDVNGVAQAMHRARSHVGQPAFINVRTIIAYGSSSQGHARTHGDALGEDDVASIKRRFAMDPDEHFVIPADVYELFAASVSRGQQQEDDYQRMLKRYDRAFPELSKDLRSRMQADPPLWQSFIPRREEFSREKTPTRVSAAQVCARLAKDIPNIMVTTSDLRPAVNMSWEGHVCFQHPDLRTACGINGNYGGRYMYSGIREHAMVAVANGLASFHPRMILPITSAFFMFYSYAAAAVRSGALQGLPVIHLATHDSIAIGEDGPTHQPIELPALFRAMPNFLYIRPCDAEETCGAFSVALDQGGTPTMLSLSRHPAEQYPAWSSREGVARGAYVFVDEGVAHVTLIGVGSEMAFAVNTIRLLLTMGIRARIVSFPCQRLFEAQGREYKEIVMQYSKRKLVVVIEAYAVNGWERYADAGYNLSSFGKSLPAEVEIYKYFGFETTKIGASIGALVERIKDSGPEILRGDFQDLNRDMKGVGRDHEG